MVSVLGLLSRNFILPNGKKLIQPHDVDNSGVYGKCDSTRGLQCVGPNVKGAGDNGILCIGGKNNRLSLNTVVSQPDPD